MQGLGSGPTSGPGRDNLAKLKKANKTPKTRGKYPKTQANSRILGNPYRLIGLLAVVILSLILNSVGLDWGLSGLVPWQPDSNEGITIVREMPRLLGRWTYKYPRGHFLLNGIFYYPLLKYWQSHPVRAIGPDGQPVLQTLNLPRLALLARITRIISVIMGTGTVIIVFLIAIRLFQDYLAALLSALALTLSQLFVFYCHQGNSYIPYVFWYALGFYWMLKVMHSGKLRHYVFMGLCFSFSICTYDAVGGYLAGLALAFWLAMIARGRVEGRSLRAATLSVFSKKILVAGCVFLFTYALIQGILTSPGAFADRMSIWLGGRGVVEFNKDFRGQLPLLWQAGRRLYGSLGWPLLAIAAVSLVYLSLKHPFKSALLIIPFIAFYLIIVMNIRMCFPRYFLPAFIGLAVLVGKGCADWLTHNRLPICLRVIPIALIYLLSLLYCIGVDLEMLSDTRVRTEQWFYKNVRRDCIIGAGLMNRVYAPRLYLNGIPGQNLRFQTI